MMWILLYLVGCVISCLMMFRVLMKDAYNAKKDFVANDVYEVAGVVIFITILSYLGIAMIIFFETSSYIGELMVKSNKKVIKTHSDLKKMFSKETIDDNGPVCYKK